METDGMKYARSVLNGEVVAGNLIKLACTRFLNDLERKDLVFDFEKADYVKRFISLFHHFTGKFSKVKFELLPWQKMLVENLYGFYWLDGRRRFTTCYLQLARKGGKTELAAALVLYHLIADGEPDSNVFLCASSKEQAKYAYKACKEFATQLDVKENIYKCYRDEIKYNKGTNRLKVLASDAKRLDGSNPSCILIDEYHAHPNSDVRDAMKSGTGMRTQPMEIVITTAGTSKLTPCYTLRCACVEVLHSLKIDDSQFTLIFELDEGDDWTNPDNFIKAQPNLGVTVSLDYMLTELQKAKNQPSEEPNFKTKLLNMFVDSYTVWIPSQYLLDSSKPVNFEDFKGERSYLGVDLASVSDLTVVSYLFNKDDKYFIKCLFYLPEESLNTSPDSAFYKQWKREGYLITTPGNVTDYDYILADIKDVSKIFKIRTIYYDSWNATSFATKATSERLPLEPFSQTTGNFNGATRELERLMLTGQVVIDNNPILRWNFDNIALRADYNGNVKPDKNKSGSKIDGVIATIQALAAYMKDNNKPKTKIYS